MGETVVAGHEKSSLIGTPHPLEIVVEGDCVGVVNGPAKFKKSYFIDFSLHVVEVEVLLVHVASSGETHLNSIGSNTKFSGQYWNEMCKTNILQDLE